ncbi:ABC transporter permease [Clostridium uliginosum]|uniref:ABC-2 family transporter protein n=1 Tax=Clostridium uliginosum TaxID=119641 RepID=A0A1I1QB11_9CLOT|nr:ABC transporter permease [Clostridium uliginosum]SFD15330.1 ABC-2 family transporter protein [Clostridium uliginosum]
MINLLKLEIYKLKHSKSFLLISAVTIFFEIINVIKNGSITGARAFQGSMYDIATLMLLGSIFAGIFIGTDFVDRIINQEIVAGHSRLSILVSKAITFFFATEIIMLIYPITSVIVNTILSGWGEVFNGTTIIYIVRTILLRMILDASCISLWVFVAFLFKDVAKTMGISFFIFMVGAISLVQLSTKSALIKTIYNFTAHSQARIIVNKVLTYSEVTSIIISKLIIISILLCASYFIFRRVELK